MNAINLEDAEYPHDNDTVTFAAEFPTCRSANPPNVAPAEIMDATHSCGQCKMRPFKLGDSEHSDHHSILSVFEAASTIREEVAQKREALRNSGDKFNENQFRAREIDLAMRDDLKVYTGRLLAAQEILKTWLAHLLGQCKEALKSTNSDDFEIQQITLSSLLEQENSLRSRMAILERVLLIGSRHQMGGINGYAAAKGTLEDSSRTDPIRIQSDSKIISQREANRRVVYARIRESVADAERSLTDYLKETSFGTVDLQTSSFSKSSKGILDLQTSQKLRDLTGLPLNPNLRTLEATLPYWSLTESPEVSGLLHRIDTFHPQWDLVRAALYHKGWLAIYKLDPAKLDDAKTELNPFHIRSSDSALLQSAALRQPRMEDESYAQPPECIIPLAECTVASIDSSISPVGQLLNQTSPKYGVEIVRYREGVPITYWVLSSDDPRVAEQWLQTLKEGTKMALQSLALSRGSSVFTPSTNPALHPLELGIRMPPTGSRWAAMHSVAGTAAGKLGSKHYSRAELF